MASIRETNSNKSILMGCINEFVEAFDSLIYRSMNLCKLFELAENPDNGILLVDDLTTAHTQASMEIILAMKYLQFHNGNDVCEMLTEFSRDLLARSLEIKKEKE